MASAASSDACGSAFNLAAALAMPLWIGAIGNCRPIRPVEQTRRLQPIGPRSTEQAPCLITLFSLPAVAVGVAAIDDTATTDFICTFIEDFTSMYDRCSAEVILGKYAGGFAGFFGSEQGEIEPLGVFGLKQDIAGDCGELNPGQSARPPENSISWTVIGACMIPRYDSAKAGGFFRLYLRFIIWTKACPLAPLSRLSIAEVMTNRSVLGSNTAERSQRFVPTTCFVSGNVPDGRMPTKGDFS